MKLSDRIAAIEAGVTYLAATLTDVADPDDSALHTLTYTVQGVKKGLGPDGVMVDIGPADPVDIKEIWRVYDSGLSTEYIERIA